MALTVSAPASPLSGVLAPTGDAIREAARLLRDGHLVIIPTETVYGVAALASSPAAMARLYAAKGRPPAKPVARMISSADALAAALGIAPPPAAQRLAGTFWPGPLTLVLTGADGIPVGYRVPDHPVALAWLRALGGAVPAVTSANRSGEPAATDAASAWRALRPHAALALDGGPSSQARASTVVQLEGRTLRILREGPIPASRIAAVAALPGHSGAGM